jgi:hypothetical protein
MPFKLLDAGSVLRTATSMKVQDASGLRRVIRMKVMAVDNVTLVTVATFVQPLTLSATDAYDEGYDAAYVAFATVSPSGGLGPYSYSWAYVSGTAMTVTGASTATATFGSPVMTPGTSVSAVYRCTCTDSSGQTATADSNVSFTFLTPP